jgi:hypothetical protein
MAEPIDAEATREAVADQLEALDANIAELDAQLLKLHAVTKAAIRAGALDADAAKRTALILITALNDARGWRARFAEVRRVAQTEEAT